MMQVIEISKHGMPLRDDAGCEQLKTGWKTSE
jgi:hypothetical protein